MEQQLSWVRAVLSTTAQRWSDIAGSAPEALLTRRPLPDQWSARECLRHLLDTESRVFPSRVRALLAGQDMPAFNPDAEGSPDSATATAELAAELVRLRQISLALLDTVTAEDLPRRGRHQELGMVTLNQLLHEWAAHDLNHTIQAEQAIMQPFIAACGPWRGYFKSHDLS